MFEAENGFDDQHLAGYRADDFTLVRSTGISFHDAHHLVSNAVKELIATGIGLKVSAMPIRGLLTLLAVAVANQCRIVCSVQFLTPAASIIRRKAFSTVL